MNHLINQFQLGAISLSEASKIAKLSIYEFLEVLKINDVPVIDYKSEDLENEHKNLLQFFKIN